MHYTHAIEVAKAGVDIIIGVDSGIHHTHAKK